MDFFGFGHNKSDDESHSPEHFITKGLEYEHGTNNRDKNPEKAFQNFCKASTLHFSEGEYHTGRCYQLGIGTDFSFENAFNYYHAAAAQNHCAAQ